MTKRASKLLGVICLSVVVVACVVGAYGGGQGSLGSQAFDKLPVAGPSPVACPKENCPCKDCPRKDGKCQDCKCKDCPCKDCPCKDCKCQDCKCENGKCPKGTCSRSGAEQNAAAASCKLTKDSQRSCDGCPKKPGGCPKKPGGCPKGDR